MGKVINKRYITKPGMRRKRKYEGYSILMGANLRNFTSASSQKPKPVAPPAAPAKPQQTDK